MRKTNYPKLIFPLLNQLIYNNKSREISLPLSTNPYHSLIIPRARLDSKNVYRYKDSSNLYDVISGIPYHMDLERRNPFCFEASHW